MDVSGNTSNASATGCNWHDREGVHETSEDQITEWRWRLGFFAVYCAFVFVIGGFVLFADRPRDFASTAAPPTPSVASIAVARAPHR